MKRSKAGKERAAKAERRVATQATKESFGKSVAQAPAEAVRLDYAVLVDTQGVAYLRVEPLKFVINTGKEVKLVEMDAKTVKSRGLKVVDEASGPSGILDAAKILAHPLTDSVIISERARPYLVKILNDKELTDMATKKATAKKAARKANGTPRAERVSPTVTFKKMAKEGDLPKQAIGILAVLKAKGKQTVAELVKALEGKIETKQPTQVIWSFYRSKLVKEGYVTVSA